MGILRVLVADDHPMFRYGLRAVLGSDPSTELVGEAGTGEEAVELALALRPDVIVMDLTMPGLNGLAATEQIVAQLPATNILVVTMFEDPASVLAAVHAGARGYLVKGADRDEVLRAIHTTAAGATTFSPGAARHIANELTGARRREGLPGFAGLTGRELQILELMVDGQTNTAIARRFGLSAKTVRNYTSSVLTKLGADSREDGIAKARAAGIGRPEHD